MSDAPELFAGQFVMVDIPGTTLDPDTAEFLRRSAIRAVCLFRHNLGSEDEILALTTALKDVLGPGGLIAVDQEGGSVIRATSVPQAPSAMALGAIDDTDLAYAVGAAVARGLAHLGINWNFAPVLDVNNNPENAVIGARSFGADPQRVATLAQAWLRGSLSNGVACCVKHFPGHGDTHVDSHLALPRVDKSRAALEACELLPFHALSAEAPAIMSAHIVYAAWDKERPATLAPTLLTDLLRNTWQYQGVVITDALNMGAIRDFCGKDRHGEVGVMALSAGADMVMALGERADQQRALDAITQALATGKLDAARLAASRERLNALAQRYPLRAVPYTAELRVSDQALMEKVWELALTCSGNAVPPAPTEPLRVVFAASSAGDGVSDSGLSDEQVRALFARHSLQGDVHFCPIENIDQLIWDSLPEPQRYTVLVSTSRSRCSAVAKDWKPDLHLVLWNPFQVLDVAAPALISWGFAEGARRAVAAWLNSEIDASGRTPVPLSNLNNAASLQKARAKMLNTETPDTRHPQLDCYATTDLVNALIDDQLLAVQAVRTASEGLAQAVDAAAARLAKGGRLIYVGAGTSGRLGVLDSVELLPTFSWPPERALALIAGGDSAMYRAVEGAEDDAAQGSADLIGLQPGSNDVVILLAASGATPYVMGALKTARDAGTLTIAFANNPNAPLTNAAEIGITLDTGSEVISGSTRLKAGTSQKIALNTLSSAIMVRLNKVHGNLMVDLQPTNAKLYRRAIRLVVLATGCTDEAAQAALESSQYRVKTAIVMVARGIDVAKAESLLAAAEGSVRRALVALV